MLTSQNSSSTGPQVFRWPFHGAWCAILPCRRCRCRCGRWPLRASPGCTALRDGLTDLGSGSKGQNPPRTFTHCGTLGANLGGCHDFKGIAKQVTWIFCEILVETTGFYSDKPWGFLQHVQGIQVWKESQIDTVDEAAQRYNLDRVSHRLVCLTHVFFSHQKWKSCSFSRVA